MATPTTAMPLVRLARSVTSAAAAEATAMLPADIPQRRREMTKTQNSPETTQRA